MSTIIISTGYLKLKFKKPLYNKFILLNLNLECQSWKCFKNIYVFRNHKRNVMYVFYSFDEGRDKRDNAREQVSLFYQSRIFDIANLTVLSYTIANLVCWFTYKIIIII